MLTYTATVDLGSKNRLELAYNTNYRHVEFTLQTTEDPSRPARIFFLNQKAVEELIEVLWQYKRDQYADDPDGLEESE